MLRQSILVSSWFTLFYWDCQLTLMLPHLVAEVIWAAPAVGEAILGVMTDVRSRDEEAASVTSPVSPREI